MVLIPLRKKEAQAPAYIPIDAVRALAGQGLSEPEIINELRKQGYSPSQIDFALTGALKTEVGGPQPPVPRYQEERQNIPIELKSPSLQIPTEAERFAPPERVVSSRPEPLISEQPEEGTRFTFEETPKEAFEKKELQPEITLEEIIEGVIAERWATFDDRLGNFEQRDMQLQDQIESLREQISELNRKAKMSEQTVVQKIEEYGGSVSGIESRIGSIEKAFRDFLPELTENIRIMGEIVSKAKKEEKKEK